MHPSAGANVDPPERHEKITRRPVVYCARVEPIPGHDVPSALPPSVEEYDDECGSMHLPTSYFGTAPSFLAAGTPSGIVLSTLASSAEAKRAKPAGELPDPSLAKSTPPSRAPASDPEPPNLNVTLLPPLAFCTKSWVMKSNPGSVLDAARNVGVFDPADAGAPGKATTPVATASVRLAAPASRESEC